MQLRAIVLDHLWIRLGDAARAGDPAQVERLWHLLDGLERLSEPQVQRLFEFLEQLPHVPGAANR